MRKLEQKIELSNPLNTVIGKIFYPVFAVVFFGFLLKEEWEKPLNDWSDLIVPVVFCFGFVGFIFLYYVLPLKRVWIDRDQIYVSNLIRTIIVEKGSIEDVKETIFSHPKMITIKFKAKTPFREKIKFLPIGGSFWRSSQHVIDKIKNKND